MLRLAFLLIALLCSPAFAQYQSFPPGTFQSRGPLDAGAAAYVGPLDINGTAFAFWSTRCGSTNYTGNILDITDSATGNTTGTRLKCSAGGVISAVVGSTCGTTSGGGTFVTGGTCSPLATTCATACNVLAVYDQSGNTNCTTACDAVQATNASRPTLVQNCQNSKICITGIGQAMPTPALSASQAQALSATLVADRTSNFTSFKLGIGGSNATLGFGFTNSANTAYITADGSTTNLTATANDSVIHAMQGLYNGASSKLSIDGSTTSGTVATNGIASGGGNIMGFVGCPCLALTGNIFEAGWWAGDKSANNSSMNSNQHAYWSF